MIDLAKVGYHPNNREKQMIIVANVQRLINMMVKDGFNPGIFKGMVQEAPKCVEDWRKANARLWNRSEGYLASSNLSDLFHFTLMGSHSTSAFRGFKYGLKTTMEHLA